MSIFDFNITVDDTTSYGEFLDRCTCTICGWDGIPSECTIEIEQESWEMSEYKVYLCPKCDTEEPLEHYPSKGTNNDTNI